MKIAHYSTAAKKDLKRYRNKPQKMKNLYVVLSYLISGLEVPQKYKPHKLLGQYNGCLECHIESDFLIIWMDEDSDIIEVVRIGTHSELFR